MPAESKFMSLGIFISKIVIVGHDKAETNFNNVLHWMWSWEKTSFSMCHKAFENTKYLTLRNQKKWYNQRQNSNKIDEQYCLPNKVF